MKLLPQPKGNIRSEMQLNLGIGILIVSLIATVIIFVLAIIYRSAGIDWRNYIILLGILELLFLIASLVFLQRTIKRDIELEQTKDVFIALASHQLRTQPTAIKNFTSMLLEGYTGKLTPKQRHYIELLQASNESQLRIIEGVLCVAELESKLFKLVPEPVDTVALLHEVLTEQQPRISEQRQEVEITAPKKLIIVTDRRVLRTAMENLLSNASKYTPAEGSIFMEIKIDDGKFVLTVRDTGVGIAKKDMSRLFTKFSRIDNDFSIKVAGTGLGLYIIKTIANLLHGSVSVTSTENQGSTFILKLPHKPKT